MVCLSVWAHERCFNPSVHLGRCRDLYWDAAHAVSLARRYWVDGNRRAVAGLDFLDPRRLDRIGVHCGHDLDPALACIVFDPPFGAFAGCQTFWLGPSLKRVFDD